MARIDYFRLESLPDVIIYHITQYLSPRDRGNLAQVDRYFREVFNSRPQLWHDVKIRIILHAKTDPQVLEILKARRIRDLRICFRDASLYSSLTEYLFGHLESLSLIETRECTVEALYNAASSSLVNLKKLAFGRLDERLREDPYTARNNMYVHVTFLVLFKRLPSIEEVSFSGWLDIWSSVRSAVLSNKVILFVLLHLL